MPSFVPATSLAGITVGVKTQLSKGHQRWMTRNSRGHFQSFIGELNAEHQAMAAEEYRRVYRLFDERVRANGRPQRQPGQRKMHQAMNPRKWETEMRTPFWTVDSANTAKAGFMLHVADGLDRSPAKRYWRKVEEGYPATVVRAMFYSNPRLGTGGYFSGPNRMFNKSDPRMPQQVGSRNERQNWPSFVIEFEGYHFLRDALEGVASRVTAELARRYRFIMPSGMSDALRDAGLRGSGLRSRRIQG